jgi:hypothetical protein
MGHNDKHDHGGHDHGGHDHGGQDHGGHGHGHHGHDDIKMEVATPNGVFRGTFPERTTVQDVIKAIVKDRQLAEGDAFELFFGETPLQPVQRPLASFRLPHKVKLTLVATGSGV